MHEKRKQMFLMILMSVLLPGMLLHWGGRIPAKPGEETVPTSPTESAPEAQTVMKISVVGNDGITREMELESYVVGVVLAEMPTSYGMEALKAQAVAARTYTLRSAATGKKHAAGAVCTDPGCCQAFIEPEVYVQSMGTESDAKKTRLAVEATRGEVITYAGHLIDATYFSCSGGRTEDAVAVWGADVPYLQSVESPGEENDAHFRDRVFLPRSSLEKSLGITLSGDSSRWIGKITRTSGGGVAFAEIGGKSFTGVSLREKLELNSAAFEVEPGEEGLFFITSGNGHRVGMSQCGADAMAREGCTYREILEHYYFGISIDKIEKIL